MPEQYVDDFPLVDGLDGTEYFHMQRRVSGVWRDFKIANSRLFGISIKTHRETFNIQDIVSPAAGTFAAASTPGSIYVPIKPYAIYTPGSVNDGVTAELLGQLGYESGGDKGCTARFILNSTPQAAPLGTEFWFASIVDNIPWKFALLPDGGSTTSNGTITVWSAYAEVDMT